MFEQAFKNLDDELRKDSGCSTELDYIEQTSWVLYLKKKFLCLVETQKILLIVFSFIFLTKYSHNLILY